MLKNNVLPLRPNDATEMNNIIEQNKYPKLNLKAVLFDMDGVLYDSMPNHATAWEKVMQCHGLQLSRYDVYLNEGRTGAATIKLVCEREQKPMPNNEEIEIIYREKTEYLQQLPPIKIMAGSYELTEKIKKSNLIQTVVTGSATSSLLDGLNKNFPNTFKRELMVTADDVKFGKPNPEPYLQALKKCSIDACNAIVVENAPLGIEAARAAGIFTIAVNTGVLENQVLIDAGANLLYSSMQDLCDDWDTLYKILSEK